MQEKALEKIGFVEEHRYFRQPQAAYFLEFPTGALATGDSPVSDLQEVQAETGLLTWLTPTTCIKDRLSAYDHWAGRQSLLQAA